MKSWRPKEGWHNPEKGKPDLHYGRSIISTEKIFEAGADTMHETDVEWLEKHIEIIAELNDSYARAITFVVPEEDWKSFKGEEVKK